ncbi:hypothetical protein BV22DRAFT_1194857 [Leucogyrophana mollusca]|uniref:Uncharacterized protein n=1 Tax=Leucogyrophana mollusca TaxID=85980 RepID=A0ACB8BJ02_9AGAM|nr:hypothetical protein BV22DRAFT_1194857 [Leucogyrophana mollusca]
MILGVAAAYSCLIALAAAQYSPAPRWGQAAALLEDTLYAHGGLTDPYNTYSYSSAPPTAEIFLLDLSASFNPISPPWQLLSNSTTTASSPALGWHSLSAFNTSTLLLFGGQPGPNSQTVLTTLNDSASLLSAFDRTDPSFLMEPQNWAGEPMRRMRHSASSTGGKIWVIGGEKADGSGSAFSDHYVFDPFVLDFMRLPTANAPPDIYGHTSLVLPDGRLIVFGGFCASSVELVPLSRIWSLDTTQETLSWDLLPVSSASLPNPRRDFAAVVLVNGEILIQGGGDGQLENTYSDGWVLDTSQNPMVWQAVEALEQIGPRKDHFAIQVGGQVLFGFGYGASSPYQSPTTGSASLQVYDPSSSAVVPSYSPPAAGSTPAINSLPPPSQTGEPNGGGSTDGTSGGSQGSGGPTVHPTGTSGTPDSAKHDTAAIALGTTFGVLGLVAGGIVTACCIRRRRGRDPQRDGRFFLLGGDPEEEGGGDVLTAGGRGDKRFTRTNVQWRGAGVLSHFGLGKNRRSPAQQRQRRDMLADEDTRQFGWGTRPGLVRREGSAGTSAWSLRSMSAMVRGIVSRDPSVSGTGGEWDPWEKVGNFGEGDREGLVKDRDFIPYGAAALGRREGSSWSYTDPFADTERGNGDDEYADFDIRPGDQVDDHEYNQYNLDGERIDDLDPPRLRPLRTLLPLSVPLHTLSPLREVGTSHSDQSNSLLSGSGSSQGHSSQEHPTSIFSTQPTTPLSQTSHSPTTPRSSHIPLSKFSPLQRHSSLLNSRPPPTQPIRRSDSWWIRFARTSLLERRSSGASERVLDFRDPNPAPRLVAIEETSKCSPESPGSKKGLSGGHGHSVSSSVHSGRTADTAAAERLGGSYDVVQRVASDGSGPRRTSSFDSVDTSVHGVLAATSSTPSQGLDLQKTTSATPTSVLGETSISPFSSPSDPPTPPSKGPSPPRLGSNRGGGVSSRVRAYERRISQDLGDEISPPPRNTRKLEEAPSRNRVSIKYGLAPRPSLYVANPDGGGLS